MSTPVVDHRAPAGTGAHAGAAPLAARWGIEPVVEPLVLPSFEREDRAAATTRSAVKPIPM